ncbi:hypothetical protein T484DRAFT_1754524 [Baffinella frigidus]|nr:hypothetical protein T484DRAFT_1754524 [Cryptophyta sp. CCMP2293]
MSTWDPYELVYHMYELVYNELPRTTYLAPLQQSGHTVGSKLGIPPVTGHEMSVITYSPNILGTQSTSQRFKQTQDIIVVLSMSYAPPTGLALHGTDLQCESLLKLLKAAERVDTPLAAASATPPAAASATPPAAASAWTKFVDKAWVEAIVTRVPAFAVSDPGFAALLVREFGSETIPFETASHHRAALKMILSEKLMGLLSQSLVQDTRCDDKARTIISPVLLADEITSGVVFMMRPGRIFVVNDPLSFKCAFRELQRHHPSWPLIHHSNVSRGTKGITDVLSRLGFGPPDQCRSWSSRAFRGARDTDPDWNHPDGVQETRETDGLYFTQYTFCPERGAKNRERANTKAVKGRKRALEVPVVPVLWVGRSTLRRACEIFPPY